MKDLDYVMQLDRAAEERAAAYRASQNRRQRLLFLFVMLPALAMAMWGAVTACKIILYGPEEPSKAPPAPAAGQHEAPSELQPGVPVKEGQSIRFLF